jgi:hypothetical protein
LGLSSNLLIVILAQMKIPIDLIVWICLVNK